MADIKLPELLLHGVLIFNGRLPDKASSGIFNQAWWREGEAGTGGGSGCILPTRRCATTKVDGDDKRWRGSRRTVAGERVDRRCLRIPGED